MPASSSLVKPGSTAGRFASVARIPDLPDRVDRAFKIHASEALTGFLRVSRAAISACNLGVRAVFFALGRLWPGPSSAVNGDWTLLFDFFLPEIAGPVLSADFSGSHNHKLRSVNSKPSRCRMYPTILPARGQFDPTATPAPKASSPLRTTFRLGMSAAFLRSNEKASFFVYYFSLVFRCLGGARLTGRG